jgi:hypothetical protein
MSIQRSGVTFFEIVQPNIVQELTRCIVFPDLDVLASKNRGVRTSGNKPQEFFDDSANENALVVKMGIEFQIEYHRRPNTVLLPSQSCLVGLLHSLI